MLCKRPPLLAVAVAVAVAFALALLPPTALAGILNSTIEFQLWHAGQRPIHFELS